MLVSPPSSGTSAAHSALRDLYPAIEPYASGMLRVDDLHTLYWEECGNPHGVPVVFLHGGPGAGANATHRRFFDPIAWRIIIFDQRGAGRSRPLGEIQRNNTEFLIDDIELLRQHFKIERWHVFGGSWGSTLAIAYAQAHPAHCLSLTMRGICLMRRSEIDWFMYGMRTVFPEAWGKFASIVAPEERNDLVSAYNKLFHGADQKRRLEAVEAWSTYESSCSTLRPPREMPPVLASDQYRIGISIIEAHYFAHNLFTPDAKLLNDIGRIRHIPAVLVQGRYDMVCPIVTANEVHQAWPEAEYRVIPDAGHSALEPGIRSALLDATDKFKLIGA